MTGKPFDVRYMRIFALLAAFWHIRRALQTKRVPDALIRWIETQKGSNL